MPRNSVSVATSAMMCSSVPEVYQLELHPQLRRGRTQLHERDCELQQYRMRHRRMSWDEANCALDLTVHVIEHCAIWMCILSSKNNRLGFIVHKLQSIVG